MRPYGWSLVCIAVLIAFVGICRADGYTFPMTCMGQVYQALADSRKDGAFTNELKCCICKGHIFAKRRIEGEWVPLGWRYGYRWGRDDSHCVGEQNIKVLTYAECVDILMEPLWLNTNRHPW